MCHSRHHHRRPVERTAPEPRDPALDGRRKLFHRHAAARGADQEALLDQIRFDDVFQGAALFDSLTVRENVGYRLFEESPMPIAEIDERVREVTIEHPAQRVGDQRLAPTLSLMAGVDREVKLCVEGQVTQREVLDGQPYEFSAPDTRVEQDEQDDHHHRDRDRALQRVFVTVENQFGRATLRVDIAEVCEGQ